MKLENLAEIIIGDSPPLLSNNSDYLGDVINFATVIDVKENKYLSKTRTVLNSKSLKYLKIVPKNTLLLSIAGTIGKPVITDCEMAISQSFVAFTNLSSNVDINYLYFYFYNLYLNNGFAQYVTKSTHQNISLKTIKNIELKDLPTLEQQAKVVNYIESINNFSNNKKIEILNLNKFKDNMLIETFNNEIMSKNEEFTISKLKEVSKINIGRTPKNPDLFYTTESNYFFAGLKQLPVDSNIINSTNICVHESELKQSIFVKPDSLILTVYGDVGNLYLNNTNLCISQALVSFQDNLVDTKYLYYYIQYLKANKTLEKYTAGSQSQNMSKKDIANFDIKVYNNEIQKKIVKYFSMLDKYININIEQLNQYKILQKETIKKYF